MALEPFYDRSDVGWGVGSNPLTLIFHLPTLELIVLFMGKGNEEDLSYYFRYSFGG